MVESSDPYRRDSSAVGPVGETPSIGDVVGGKYRVESVIGQGGMGAVFRARHLLTERAVALKWMLPEVGGEEAVQRFLREARAMGRIDHRGVVGVLDVGVEDGATFLVMELLKGSSLRELLEERGRFEPAEAIALLMPALEGVEAAHRSAVVHRDLKPENLFVVRGGDGTIETTKVLDFGISKLRDDRIDQGPQIDRERGGLVTRTGVTIGTPSYMSPEQVRAAKDIDGRTDVWSLGVILYELLAGEVPFRAESFGALLVAIATEGFPPLDAVRPGLPRELVAVVHRALEKEPAQRFASVAELATALEPFGPPGLRFRMPDVARPNEPALDPPPGVLAPRTPGTVRAAAEPERAAPPTAATVMARPKPAPAIHEAELDLSPRPVRLGTAHTAVPSSGHSAEPEQAPRIPSLPPLALEDVPRRKPAPLPAPAPPARPRREPTRPAQETAHATRPNDAPSADATRWLKRGVSLVVVALALALAIRVALAMLRPVEPVAPSPSTRTPGPSPVASPAPDSPARRSPAPRSPAAPRPTTPPSWPPPPIDPATLGPAPEAATSSDGHARAERVRPRAEGPRPSTPEVAARPAETPPTAPTLDSTATPASASGPPTTPSGRTGSLTREDF
ncbi:MAG: hypothetical protein OHK0013_02020 [Sandaracinaceae bacterium]